MAAGQAEVRKSDLYHEGRDECEDSAIGFVLHGTETI
jgi:hypothetical protein